MNFLKGRAILWLLIPITVIVAFLWDRTEVATPNFIQEKTNPDYFLINTESYDFNAEGLQERQFTSAKTLHYIFKQETAMENPVLTIINSNNEQWKVTANKATNKELSEELLLTNGVSILISDAGGASAELTTDNLLIDLASENASTKSAILLKSNLYQLTAVGMNADLKENVIHFKSKVVSEEL